MKDIDRYTNPKKRKDYLKKYQAKWRLKDIAKTYARNWARKRRREAIEHYGAKCCCCGETIYEFLSIDHINGGGTKHKKEIKNAHLGIWLRKNNYPSGFQILCHNCNQGKSILGICPHKKI